MSGGITSPPAFQIVAWRNPTITPRSMPGSMMSPKQRHARFQNKQHAETPLQSRRLPKSRAASNGTRFDKNPMATPETSPFRSENVMTLPISGGQRRLEKNR